MYNIAVTVFEVFSLTVHGLRLFDAFLCRNNGRNRAVFGQIWLNLEFKMVIYWYTLSQLSRLQLIGHLFDHKSNISIL